jgi:hypothetical protein
MALALLAAGCAGPLLPDGDHGGPTVDLGRADDLAADARDLGQPEAPPDLARTQAAPDLARPEAPPDLALPRDLAQPADLAQLQQPDLAPVDTCAHAICTTGNKLVSGCNPCATKICAKDSYCCTVGWNKYCVDEVSSICHQSCP